MNHIFAKTILPVLGILLLAGCAKEPKTQVNYANKLYFDAWIHVNHPQAVESGNGIYILEDIPGTGAQWSVTGDRFAYVDYTVTDLEGVVSATTDEQLAKKVGLYAKGDYYGPRIQVIAENSCAAGLEDALAGMRIGGTRTVAVPLWLQTTARFDTKDEYLDNSVQASNTIYKLTLRKAIPDGTVNGVSRIYKWETDSLDRYVKLHLGADVDSTAYSTEEGSYKYGFYFKSLTENLDTTALNSGNSYYINYTGRLLNGQVFDTTIADTAKVHGIYSASKSYGPVLINWGEKYSDLTMGDSESAVIDGFKMALFKMHLHEKAIAAFYSVLGYGYDGSGSTIPGFSPLVFEFELLEEN